MRLKPDIVRDVLLYIEETLDYDRNKPYLEQWDIMKALERNKSYHQDEVKYTIEVLLTTNFLNLVNPPVYDSDGGLIIVRIKGLTFDGCNFLDNIRKPEVWNVVKKKAKSLGVFSITSLSYAGATLCNALLADPNALQNFMQGIDNTKRLIGL